MQPKEIYQFSYIYYHSLTVLVILGILFSYWCHNYIMFNKSTSTLKTLASKARLRMYTTVERGSAGNGDYRMFYKNSEGQVISPFHDIPLFANTDDGSILYNMIVEIPRWSHAKMEIATKEPFNPIKQDQKKGKLRNVPNPFPYHGYIWNYGAFPQTWENPSYLDLHTNAKGDNDPIDVCEIGTASLPRGSVVPVKVLGIMALIDEGETDWKVIVIKADDPLADSVNNIGDVQVQMPGLLHATREWLRIYKIPDGKPPNEFAFGGHAKNADFAKKIIEETHQQWKDLIFKTKVGGQKLELQNISLEKSPFKVSSEAATNCLNSQPEFTPSKGMTQEERDEVMKVSYIKHQ